MSLINCIFKRGISTSTALLGKRNFKKFSLYNKRGTRAFKKQQSENPILPIHKRGVKDVGYHLGNKFIAIPEKIPEIIVPDLTDCKFMPYVSYRAPEITQAPFTSEDLFNVIYAKKIVEDFQNGKLDDSGQPLEPSIDEKMTAEEAKIKAQKTGTDIF